MIIKRSRLRRFSFFKSNNHSFRTISTISTSIARKSIVAACDIKAGEVFTEQNLTVKRPGNGVSPMLWEKVLGQKAKRDFNEDELIAL